MTSKGGSMRLNRAAVAAIVTMSGVFLLPLAPMLAHHGSSISYDMEHIWTTKATVTEFHYANPHPWLDFDRVNDKGEVEHWTAELITNPTFLLRAGWTKSRSEQTLKPGTVVELTLGTSKVGGFNGCIRDIKSDKGEPLLDTGRFGTG